MSHNPTVPVFTRGYISVPVGTPDWHLFWEDLLLGHQLPPHQGLRATNVEQDVVYNLPFNYSMKS